MDLCTNFGHEETKRTVDNLEGGRRIQLHHAYLSVVLSSGILSLIDHGRVTDFEKFLRDSLVLIMLERFQEAGDE